MCNGHDMCMWRRVCWIVVEDSEIMDVGRCALPTYEILDYIDWVCLLHYLIGAAMSGQELVGAAVKST